MGLKKIIKDHSSVCEPLFMNVHAARVFGAPRGRRVEFTL